MNRAPGPVAGGRAPGPSVRLKLTLSYAGFLVLASGLLLAAVWVFLLRYVPERALLVSADTTGHGVFPVRSNLLRVFAPRAAAVMAFVLLLGLVGGWLLAGRMLAPLTQITDAARRVGRGTLTHRIRMTGRQDEFRELSDTFDAMLGELESHMDEQRRFAANASHELRTPLAITRSLLDVARRDPARDHREIIDRLHAVNARAIDLTEALLLLSRGDSGSFTRERVDLSLLAEEAAESLLALAEQRGTALDVTGGAAHTDGSAELLLRMVTNLVQNAVVHNVPSGGTVTVHTTADGDSSVLRVENSGPRLSPDLVATLAEPFQRGTARVRTGEHVGAGLGLAIVASVVRAHDGRLDLRPRSAGGLVVTVRLPNTP